MADYDVGYKKPPKRSRFKKGESGNPRGRPKRPKYAVPEMYETRMNALILVEAYRLVDIQEGGKKTRLPLIQAIIRGWAFPPRRDAHVRCVTLWTSSTRLKKETSPRTRPMPRQ